MPLRNARDLDMPDAGKILPQGHGHVALDNLRVIKIHLNLEVRFTNLLADRVSFVLRVKKEAWNIPRVDRLDQECPALLGEFARGIAQVLDVHSAMPCPVRAGGQ